MKLALSAGLVFAAISCNFRLAEAQVPGCAFPNNTSQVANIVQQLGCFELQQFKLPSISIAVSQKGNLLTAQAFGWHDFATTTPATPTDTFQLGSLTKQYTAALIMTLVNAQKVDLDKAASTYDGALPNDISVRQLLNHTSGLADYLSFPGFSQWAKNGVQTVTVINAIGSAPRHFSPGTRFEYSNSNYYLLGRIIEQVSGQSYKAYLRGTILQPLGLNDTNYGPTSTGYRFFGAPIASWDASATYSAGALSATATDVATWDDALFGGSLINRTLLGIMQTPTRVPTLQNPSILSNYGMGINTVPVAGGRLMYHSGAIAGFSSMNYFFPSGRVAIVVLVSQDYSTYHNIQGFSDVIANRLCKGLQAPLSGSCG